MNDFCSATFCAVMNTLEGWTGTLEEMRSDTTFIIACMEEYEAVKERFRIYMEMGGDDIENMC